ncbi:hypothetical protein [Phytomonospora endophytica]|uniref:Uncharacterized protein n=1 Tax=Phytomonospora endophytica TaxID=714109 RepID=A0A841G4F7_9ACTN|nr:hypothetical protein [Phytomonospora endophytica]MBB6039609.1 hypothetical protein [Phytomonospora endophytica]GIG65673.1 hypothetical protein Pen01_19680 [Phytomonospora endophytica]
MRAWLALWRCGPLVVAAALVPVPFALSGTVPWTLPLALAVTGALMRYGSKGFVDWRAAHLDRMLRSTPVVHRGVLRARAVAAWEVQTQMRRRFGLTDAVTDPDEDLLSGADAVHFALSPTDGRSAERHAEPGCAREPAESVSVGIMFACPDVPSKTRSSP